MVVDGSFGFAYLNLTGVTPGLCPTPSKDVVLWNPTQFDAKLDIGHFTRRSRLLQSGH